MLFVPAASVSSPIFVEFGDGLLTGYFALRAVCACFCELPEKETQ